MKSLIKPLVFVGCLVAALTSSAQSYWLAGDFNGWGSAAMSGGPTVYSNNVTGQPANGWGEYKVQIAAGQWGTTYPGDNLVAPYDGSGNATIYFYPGINFDGWSPSANRVGFANAGGLSLSLIGDFNAWTSDVVSLVHAGNGVYTNTYVIATAGTHTFKFRTTGSWSNFRSGADFSKAAADATVTTATNNQPVLFQLDLPHGSWVAGAPRPLYACVFQVDMTKQIAIGAFQPSSNIVFAAGTFQSSQWSGFQLVPTVANTNVYVGTNYTQDAPGTVEQYQYKFYTTNDPWELSYGNDRSFTVSAAGVTNSLVYFNDAYPTPSATTNDVTFTVNMAPQVSLGFFNPLTETVLIGGTFQSPQWTWVVLTNLPTGTNNYVYTMTFADGNYPGSYENFKYAIGRTAATNSEAGTNRVFYTPNGATSLPLAYYNNLTSIYSNHITFEVDMTVPILQGLFKPGSGDVVCAAGEFQTNGWSSREFILTNNPPLGGNTNVFYGTYVDPNAPGLFQYKFQICSSTATNYESILNRSNVVTSSSALTNPLVYWNDYNTNNVALVPTTISFRVNMNGAVDIFTNAFNPSADFVIVNGDFTTPAWPNFWKDAALLTDYPANVLNETPIGSGIYSNSYVLPAGHSIYVSYKYGIDHNDPDQLSNTNCDNEASSGNDRHRYVRGVGHYAFPLDVFGSQQTNSATGTEKVMDKLAIGNATAGKFPVTWLGGLSGVSLQTSTNLVSGIGWQDVSGTDGGSQTNWPAGSGQQFFRLKNSR